ncbi:Timeless, N-terminal [Dillenia turbinata]|uniref:Timeless, N-terminal n=1 Tax=Dillenia turbinata TaxID=194707 RepID=A0AAN8Z484_9MAGN
MDTEGLSVICSGLGIIEEDEEGNRIGYEKDEFCSDNLKDLLRFLRRDDPQTREVFKQVCKWNTVGKDLIPIIEHCQNDRNLVLNALKVLVFLTMPIEPGSNDIPQQMEYLWDLKGLITCSDTVAVVVSLLEIPLENLDREAFTEDDWKLVQLVLTFFRNILAIHDISLQQRAGGSATHFLSLRDRFLELLFNENVMDLILVLTQHVGGSCGYLRQDNLLLLEIFHYIFMGQESDWIARSSGDNSKVGTVTLLVRFSLKFAPLSPTATKGRKLHQIYEIVGATVDSLRSIIEEEEEKRKLSRLGKMGYSQFSGTFMRLTMDGSKTFCKGKPSSSCDNQLRSQKVLRGRVKRTAWDQSRLPSAKESILVLLHNFVNQFLSGGYNVLMQSIREDTEKEHHAIQNSDVITFFHVAQFVSSFQYQKLLSSKPYIEVGTSDASNDGHGDSTLFKGDICGPIAATMNESMFKLVIFKWQNAFEGLKETNDYKFLSAAGSSMKAMLRMLDLVLKISPEDSKEPHTARILLYKLFYDQTEQGMTHFLLNLFKSYDGHKQPKSIILMITLASDLEDLLEMIHVTIRLMEKLQARGSLRVSRKSRKGRKRGALTGKKDTLNDMPSDHVNLQGELPNISKSEDPTKLDCDRKQGDDPFPLQTDKPARAAAVVENAEGILPQAVNETSGYNNVDHASGTEDSSSDDQLGTTNEVDFNVSTFVSALANNSIIRHLCWLLKFYKSNSSSTNHYIICMLQRICDDLELSPMLYQLSLLIIFQDILVEQKSCPCKEYENIVHFLTGLVRRMLRKMKSQPLLFVELLFWKTRKECHYINSESLWHELGDLKKGTRNWGIGDVGLTQTAGRVSRSIADALGEDEADFLFSNELEKQKDESEGKIQKVPNSGHGTVEEEHEKVTLFSDNGNEISLSISSGCCSVGISVKHDSERASKRKKRLVFNDELEQQIKDFYLKYKDNSSCCQLIADALDSDGKITRHQVSRKLKQLGFKVPPPKRMLKSVRPVSSDADQDREEGPALASSHVYDSNDLDDSIPLGTTLNTRKRVRAFSRDQEIMINDLFQQFKDHKRCSYMIANALDADGKITAAQVSRKLKQLGLRVPRKQSEVKMHLKDDDLNDHFSDTDNETLSSLRNKHSRANMHLKDEDLDLNDQFSNTDNETLSSLRKKRSKENMHLKDEDLNDHFSDVDDENFSSLRKR